LCDIGGMATKRLKCLRDPVALPAIVERGAV